MHKYIKYYLILTLPLILLLSSCYYWMYNEPYFITQFETNNVYSEKVIQENHLLMEYLKNGKGKIESNFYTQKEIDHLQDVRILMQSGTYLLILLVLLWLVGGYVARKDLLIIMQRGGLLSLGVFILLLLLLPIFDSAFIYFHKIFFKAGTWMFDPNVSNLKRMFPNMFFYNISKNVFMSFGGLGLITALSHSLYKFLNHRIVRH